MLRFHITQVNAIISVSSSGLFSFTFAGLTSAGKETSLPLVETHCVEHALRLLSDQQWNYCKGMRRTQLAQVTFSKHIMGHVV